MMSIGEKLRTARETKCLSTKELAESTHLNEDVVIGLENDDYHAISALVYGMGFLKICASRLGLDPAPLLEEFKGNYEARKQAPAAATIDSYKAQEALYKERSGDSRLFQPASRAQKEEPSEPRPLESAPASPIQVTVQVATAPLPEPVSTPHVIAPVPPPPETPAEAAIFGAPEKPVEEDSATPDVISVDEEDTLFAQSSRKPRPVPVDPEDGRVRPMTGIFVPPSRRKTAEENSASTEKPVASTPVAPSPLPFPAPAVPEVSAPPAPSAPATVHVIDASQEGREEKSGGFSKAIGDNAKEMVHVAGKSATACGKAFLGLFPALGRGIKSLCIAIGRFFSFLGRNTVKHFRAVAQIGAALVLVLLGIWAILQIRSTIHASRETKRVVIVQSPVAPGSIEMALPPPVLYAK